MTDYPETTESEVVRDLAYAAADPTVVQPDKLDELLLWAPTDQNHKPHMVDLKEFDIRPRRTRAADTIVRDENSLIEQCQKLGDCVRVYADPTSRVVVAVLNDDESADVPGWRDRRVHLQLFPTPEWTDWTANDNKLMPQRNFAEFIEDHLTDIAEPSSADMLEIAQDLEASQSASFASGVKLQSGQRQFEYRETTEAHVGTLEVPNEFTLALTPWQGREGNPFAVKARLRYRVSAQGLTLGYKLNEIDRLLTSAFNTDIIAPIKSAGFDVVLGTP